MINIVRQCLLLFVANVVSAARNSRSFNRNHATGVGNETLLTCGRHRHWHRLSLLFLQFVFALNVMLVSARNVISTCALGKRVGR